MRYLHLRQNNAGLTYEAKPGKSWKLSMIAGHTFM